ncbi:MAG: ferritin-like domain-containing protein [Myxococcales bacterium]|nr:ferritin-like domain-containing protein [Myxococcales bacterium]
MSVFAAQHAELRGISIDFGRFDASAHDPALLVRARRVWLERLHSEFRSLQIVTRFLAELTAAGEPVEIYAGAVDLIRDEARHVGLCHDLCGALGVTPTLPDPPALVDPPEFLAAPAPQRALATALTMLLINETLSVAWLTDLAERCADPVVGAVLRATVEDEAGHDAYGFTYVQRALARFDPRLRPRWRALAHGTLARHQAWADGVLAGGSATALPDEPALADLGLFSPTRQALLYRRTWAEVLGPRLAELGLL